MGNCLRPVQNGKQQQKTQAPLQSNPHSPLKQQWINFLLVNQISRVPSVIKRVSNYNHPSFDQIQKDIDRTYPLQPQFNQPQNKLAFRQLLQMIALYYPYLGYIQGMNFIAGYFILIGMNKVQAFNTFRSIMFHPELMLVGIYQDQFPLVRLDCSIFWSMFEEQSPNFAKKVKDLNLPDQLWIFQWFLSFFIYSLPRCYINQILTFIWREKEFACVRLALAMMRIIQHVLQGKSSFQDEFIECVQMIKDEQYVKKNIPLQNLLKIAKNIDKAKVSPHAKKFQSTNKFGAYFAKAPNDRKELYEKFLEQIQESRKNYYNSINQGKKVKCIRNSSITIIDDIEQKRVEHYNSKVFQSASFKQLNQSFVKWKKTFSVSDQLKNNAILTQSLYRNIGNQDQP